YRLGQGSGGGSKRCMTKTPLARGMTFGMLVMSRSKDLSFGFSVNSIWFYSFSLEMKKAPTVLKRSALG
ncbi:MAG: hypothetical protein IKS90_00585, partial [Clostridia bacterium]|nr:hypothetical protein [Clostridia bacterium]